MRKILISLLLAGAAATPALAGPHNWYNQQTQDERQQARSDRQQAREERQQARQDARADRADNRANVNARQFNGPGPQYERPQFNGSGAPQQRFDARGGGYYGQGNGPGYYQQQREQRVQDMQQRFDQRQANRDLRQSNRPVPNVMRDRNPRVVSDVPRPGTQPPLRADSYRHDNVHWNTNWRNDRRYDWRDYRDHHRSRFHLSFYYDPFGWGYQPFYIGYRMWPAYYGNQYWIDPAMFGLPYPPPGAQWVRYWNDAVLVDMYTGTVIDVIPGFFW